MKLFEIVTDLDAAIASAPASVYWRRWEHRKSAKPERPVSAQRPHGLGQIELPFVEDDVLAVFPRFEL